MLFIISFVGAYINNIRCYIIQADKLIIHKPIKDIKLYKNEIAQIDFVGSSGLSGFKQINRLLQIGGLFVYTGSFYQYDTGQMSWCATRRDHLIMITTVSGNKFWVSPDEPQKFVPEFSEKTMIFSDLYA
jgi:hypothetical protein